MTRAFGLRSALTFLVLIAIAPVFGVVVQASLDQQQGRLLGAEVAMKAVVDLSAAHQERYVEGARQMLTAIAYSPPVYGDDLPACVEYMRKLQGQYPTAYGTFGILDASGRLTCRASPPANPVNSSDRPFFRTAAQTGRFSVGEFTLSRASGRPVLTFGMPVYRASDHGLRGVAYVALDLGHIAEQLRKPTLLPGMTLVLVDETARVLAAVGPRAVSPGSVLTDDFLRRAVAAGQPTLERSTSGNGREWLYALQAVGPPGEAKLYVAAMVASEDVLAPLTQQLWQQLLALGLITLLGATAAWLFGARVMARPIARMLQRFDALRREDSNPDTPAPPSSGLLELRELDGRFHDMAQALSERSVQRDRAMAEMSAHKNRLESEIAAAYRAEQALKESERRYRTLFKSNPHPMWVYDVENLRFLDVNDAAVAHYGYSRAEFLSMTIRDVLPRSQAADPVPDFDDGGLHPQPPLHHRLRDGRLIYVEVSSHTLEYGGHQARMVLANDITSRLLAQHALEHVNETLERRVAERTQELAVSNRELESFSYSVSHDLRAPLQVIDGFSRALLAQHARQLDERALHFLDRIRDNTRQMSELIDDLLSLARVTRAEIRAERVDLAPKATTIIERLRQRHPDREVEVIIEPQIICMGDARLLGVVLENLLENAWKFTGRTPGARIHVGHKAVKGGHDVVFVADNGAGFDMAYADKLFNPFQRLHAVTEFAGTGIGLATVHRIVTRHGGRVWAESGPGRGALFQFTLTRGTASDEEQPDSPGRGQPRSSGTHLDDAGREQCAQ